MLLFLPLSFNLQTSQYVEITCFLWKFIISTSSSFSYINFHKYTRIGWNNRFKVGRDWFLIIIQFIQFAWLSIKTSELYLIEYVGLAMVKSKKKILTGENAAWINLISSELLEKVLTDKFTKPGTKTLVRMLSLGWNILTFCLSSDGIV